MPELPRNGGGTAQLIRATHAFHIATVCTSQEGREEDAQKSLALSADLHRQDDSEAQLRTECGQKLDQGNRDDAHAVCDKLYHDDDADRLTALGMIYAQHGDLEAALKPFLRAADLSPQSPQVQ